MRLRDKVALVSGGARGIGAAISRCFAQEGARVAVADLLEEEGRRLARQLGESEGRAIFVPLDVTREEAWTRAVEAVERAFGRLDVLVNNAGIYQRGRLEETSPEDWDRMMAVNARGVFLGTRTAIPALRRAGGGSIVNLSSIAGLIGGTLATAYNASKGAVRLLTKATAVQYARENIRCNSVHPGPVETDMMDVLFPDPAEREARKGAIPAGRFCRAEEVAAAVLYLASDEASYVTGAELVIDGGFTAQ